MPNFFSRRDPWGNSPALWVVALMVFLLPLGWWSLKQLRLENDVAHWLPDHHPQVQVLEQTRKLFPTDERLFVSWDGSSLGDPRVAELARRFEGVVDQFGVKRNGLKEVSDVIQPTDALLQMQKEEVEPQEAARRLQGVVLGAGPLKIRLTDAGRIRLRKTRLELQDQVQKTSGVAARALPPMEKLETLAAIPRPAEDDESTPSEPAFPAVMNAQGQLITLEALNHDLQLIWDGITPGSDQTEDVVAELKAACGADGSPLVEECFFVLGSPVALAVALSDVGLADKSQTLQAIRRTATEAGIPAESLHLAGSLVAANQLDQKVLEAAWNPAAPWMEIQHRSVILLSVIVGAALTFLMVRNLRLACLILAVSLYAACMTLSVIPALGGGMNPVLAVMPTLLLVITLSGAIYIANYWKHTAAQDPRTAITKTFQIAQVPCALASITAAIGLAALGTSSLIPIRNFGLCGAIGGVISLGVILYGLPSLLQLWPAQPPRSEELDQRGWKEFGRMLTVRPTLQAGLFLAICLLCSWGLKNFRTETKIIRYFPESSEIVQDYRFLENELAGIDPLEVLIRFDASAQTDVSFLDRVEIVRNVAEKMRAHPEITGCLSLADFQPVAESLADEAGLLAQNRYKKRAAAIEQKIRDGELPGTKDLYLHVPENDALAIHRASAEIGVPGEEIWRITAQVRMMSAAEYGEIVQDVEGLTQEVLRFQPGSQHVVTGAVPLTFQTQQALQQSLIRSCGLALALVLGLFTLYLRSFWAGLVAMIPNVIPITIAFGLLGWFGQRTDVGVMLTASIALGIAVSGTFHFLTSYRQALIDGLDRPAAIGRGLAHCGPTICQTGLVVAISLLTLMPAELRIISRFGGIMAAMAGIALLGEMVLLPQLLAGPLGHLFTPPSPPRPAHRPNSDDAEQLPGPPHLTTLSRSKNMRIQS